MNDLIVETSSELEAKVPAVVAMASALTVSTAEQYTGAADTLKEIKSARDAVNDFFDPMVKAAFQAHKVTVAKKKALSDPLDFAEGIVKRKLLDYRTEQERIAEEQRRKLQAEADERARRERAEKEAEAAKQRAIEAEASAKAEKARQDAEQASAAERKKLLAQAAAAEKKAEAANAKAETQTEAAQMVAPAPVIHVASSAPKVAGLQTRKTWKAKVTDMPAFIAYAASAHIEWLSVNQQALDQYAKALRGAVKVPGCEFYEEANLSSSRR